MLAALAGAHLPSTACAAAGLPPPVASARAGNGLSPIWQETSFPAFDVRVWSDGASSGPLRLWFENLDRFPAYTHTPRSANYLLAGAPGQAPEISVKQVRYRRILGGRVLEVLDEPPPLTPGNPARQTPARVLTDGKLRHLKVYAVAIPLSFPTGSPGQTEDMWVLESLELEARTGPPPHRTDVQLAQAAAFRPAETDPGFADRLVLNPNIDPAYYDIGTKSDYGAAQRWGGIIREASAAGKAFRLTVYEPGVYGIDPERLARAAGTPGARIGGAVQPRLFRSGQEAPLLLDGGVSTQTSPAQGFSSLAFLVAPKEVESGQAVYWLLFPETGEAAAQPPRRMSVSSAPASPAQSTSAPTRVRFETAESPRTDYNPRIGGTQPGGRWFWKPVGGDEFAGLNLTLPPGFDPSAAESVNLTITYASPTALQSPPALELVINGSDDHRTTLSAQSGAALLKIPADVFLAGENRIAARLDYGPGNAPRHPVFVQKLTASWSQPLGPVAATALPFDTEQTTSGPVRIEFARDRNDAATSAGALLFLFAQGTGEPSALRRPDLSDPVFMKTEGTSGPCYVADPASAPAPPLIEAVKTVLDPDALGPADYLAVSPSRFAPALEPLLTRRRGDGLRTAAVDPQLLFDYFAFGERDPEAVRSFLRYAFERWPAPKLRYVLLAGEASDYRGDPAKAPAGTHEDLIPVFPAKSTESPRSDHAYATIAGDDALSDLAVGRLAVSSLRELEQAVAKIVAYEDAPVESPDWTRRVDYVYDDEEEFPRAVDEVLHRGQAPPGVPHRLRQTDYPYVPNQRVQFRKRSHAATSELLKRIHEGTSVVNFFGHGGPNLWSHERMLHLSDVPGMRNAPRLPFVTCASCDNAWLDYPVAPVNASIGEMLVTRPSGGAIGLLGPVSGASPYEHQSLVTKLMEGIYRRQIRRTGDLAAYAKNAYFVETRSASLPQQYVLSGDPAVRLRIPVVSPGLELSPGAVAADKPWATTVTFSGALLQETTGTMTVRSVETDDEVLSGTVPLPGGGGGGSITIRGLKLKTGVYAVEVTAGSKDIVYTTRLEVRPEETSAEAAAARTAAGGAAARRPGFRVYALSPLDGLVSPSAASATQFHFRVDNRSSETVGQVSARLTRADGTAIAENARWDDFAPGSNRVVTLSTTNPLPVGATTVTLEVTTAASGTSETLHLESYPIEIHAPFQLEFVEGSGRARAPGPGPVEGETVQLQALLRNTGGAAATNVAVMAPVGNPTSEDRLKTVNDTNQVIIPRIEGGDTVPVTFRWEDTFNNRTAGKPVFLTAPSTPAGNLPPASIAIKPPMFRPQANFTISDFEAHPRNPAVGTTVTLTAVVREEGGAPRGPVDIEFRLNDAVSGASAMKRQTLDRIEGARSVSASLFLDRPYGAAVATVNASKELEEANPADSSARIPLPVVVPVDAASVNELPFSGAVTSDVLSVAEQGLRLAGFFPDGEGTPITAHTVQSGRVVDENSAADHARDGQWGMSEGHAQAHATEDAGTVTLRIAAPGRRHPAARHAVTLSVAASPDGRASVPGSFQVKVEGEKEFRTLAFQPPPESGMAEVAAGEFDLEDGALDVAIRQTSGTRLLLYGAKTYPQAGAVESPVYELTGRAAGATARMRIESSNAGGGAVAGAYRTGSREGETVRWSEWRELADFLDSPVRLEGPLFQWRCGMIQGTKGLPMLTNARLTFE